MSLKIIFAGTPHFSTKALQALIDADYDVIAVYTQPDRPAGRGNKLTPSPVKQLALEFDIPVYQPLSLKDESAQVVFKSHNADLMVVVAYGLLLPETILNTPKYGCINIHASLLPRWRGAAPIQRAIEVGDAKSGVCIMQMEKGLDTGPVWLAGDVVISEDTTAGMLHDELQKLGADLLIKALPLIVKGDQSPTIQSEEGVTYAKKIEKSEAHINWDASAKLIKQKIYAFNPAPGAFSYLEGQILKIWKCRVTAKLSQLAKGSIYIDNNQLFVVSGDGILIELLEVQVAGKKALAAADFLKGNRVEGKVLA